MVLRDSVLEFEMKLMVCTGCVMVVAIAMYTMGG